MASVLLKNVYKYYEGKKGRVEAVKNLNLIIEDKEIMSLLGPSGCGKTSTLRMIAGIEDISKGALHIGGIIANNLTPTQRNIALAFEDYALYFHLTVKENLSLCLQAKKLKPNIIKKKIKEVSEMLGIEDILDLKTTALSGGQQQRVSLARALVRDPSIFLLDEPISHIETEKRYQILAEIKKINREFGSTMLYVTHNQTEAVAVSKKIGIMNFAELQQVGTKDEIYNHPINLFVANFVGEPPINIMKCKIISEEDLIILKVENSSLEFIPEDKIAKKLHELNLQEVILGLRPQNIHIKKLSNTQKSIKGIIEVIEFLGEDINLVLKSGDHNFSVFCSIDMGFKKDEELELFYDQHRLHLFHPKTEKVISV
jgi:multiple sugar transport system ATP-binding protein